MVIYYNLHCQEQCKNILPFTCRILCQPFDVLKIEGCDISELEYKNKSPNINIKLSYSCMYISMFFVTLNNCFKFIFHFLLETVKFCHHIVNPIFPVKFKASVTYSFMIFGGNTSTQTRKAWNFVNHCFIYVRSKIIVFTVHYMYFKNSLIIHEQNTKKIIAVKESLYVIKHT